MLVKVTFARLLVTQDSEPSGDAGDFEFKFYSVKPNGDSNLVVHSETTKTGDADPLPLAELGLAWSGGVKEDPPATGYKRLPGYCPDNNYEDRCFVTTDVTYGKQTIIRVMEGESLPFGITGAPTSGRTNDIGSVSITDAVPEQFGLKGYVNERGNAMPRHRGLPDRDLPGRLHRRSGRLWPHEGL